MKDLDSEFSVKNDEIFLIFCLIETRLWRLIRFLGWGKRIKESPNFILINKNFDFKQKLLQLLIADIASILNINHIESIDDGEILVFIEKTL